MSTQMQRCRSGSNITSLDIDSADPGSDALIQGDPLLLQHIQHCMRGLLDDPLRVEPGIGRETVFRDDLLLIVDQSDPCLSAADDDPCADRACLFADRRQERVAGTLDLPVPAPCGKEMPPLPHRGHTTFLSCRTASRSAARRHSPDGPEWRDCPGRL